MYIAKYCKQVLGMDLEGFRDYKKGIEEEAKTIYEKAITIRKEGTGMFFPTDEIIKITEQRDYFIVDELRKLGVEFREELTLYRI